MGGGGGGDLEGLGEAGLPAGDVEAGGHQARRGQPARASTLMRAWRRASWSSW